VLIMHHFEFFSHICMKNIINCARVDISSRKLISDKPIQLMDDFGLRKI